MPAWAGGKGGGGGGLRSPLQTALGNAGDTFGRKEPYYGPAAVGQRRQSSLDSVSQ